MNTKITSNNIELKPLYPRIMQLSRQLDERNPKFLVLFVSDKCGTVVSPSESWPVGAYYTQWNMSQFEEFTGKLTIWN